MKLQSASKKEIARIAAGVAVCDVLMIAVLLVLSLLGIGSFEFFRILISALCGSAVAVANFTILCLTIQSALDIEDQKRMKARFQLSYNARMLLQAGWAVVAFILRDRLHFLAAAIPVLFPHAIILFLQFTGRLNTGKEKPAEASGDEE